MKLGLLVCDPGRGFESMYRDWLGTDFTIYDLQHGDQPLHLDECDAYIATGSKYSVYDPEPWIQAFAQLVQRIHHAHKPFIGICFGHQMVGHALGGRVDKSPNGWGVGVHRFSIESQADWMRPAATEVHLIMSCQDQILELPPAARVLAGNTHCPAGIIQMDRMLGIQGHPEFSAAYAAELLELRRDRIGAEKVGEALASLNLPIDGALLSQWAWAFLRGEG